MIKVNESIALTNKSFLELNIDEKYFDCIVHLDLLEEFDDYIESGNYVLIKITVNDRDYRVLHGFPGDNPYGVILNGENIGMCVVGETIDQDAPKFLHEKLSKQIKNDVKEIFDWYNESIMNSEGGSYPNFLFTSVQTSESDEDN